MLWESLESKVSFETEGCEVPLVGADMETGVFRKAAEITLDLLRVHSDSLMSVLEAFVHDPLVEWTKSVRSPIPAFPKLHGLRRSMQGRSKDKDIRVSADRNLNPIKRKLRGVMEEGSVVTVPNQVEALIKQATSPAHLVGCSHSLLCLTSRC